MIKRDCTANAEISSPLDVRDALDMFLLHQIRGYMPSIVEQEDGTYIVHRGEHVVIAAEPCLA